MLILHHCYRATFREPSSTQATLPLLAYRLCCGDVEDRYSLPHLARKMARFEGSEFNAKREESRSQTLTRNVRVWLRETSLLPTLVCQTVVLGLLSVVIVGSLRCITVHDSINLSVLYQTLSTPPPPPHTHTHTHTHTRPPIALWLRWLDPAPPSL